MKQLTILLSTTITIHRQVVGAFNSKWHKSYRYKTINDWLIGWMITDG